MVEIYDQLFDVMNAILALHTAKWRKNYKSAMSQLYQPLIENKKEAKNLNKKLLMIPLIPNTFLSSLNNSEPVYTEHEEII